MKWYIDRLSALVKTHQITKPKSKFLKWCHSNNVWDDSDETESIDPYTEFRGVWEESAVISHTLHELIYVKSLRCTHIWWTALVMQWMGLCGNPQCLASTAQSERLLLREPLPGKALYNKCHKYIYIVVRRVDKLVHIDRMSLSLASLYLNRQTLDKQN